MEWPSIQHKPWVVLARLYKYCTSFVLISKVFVYENLSCVGDVKGHLGAITGLEFSAVDPFLLFTSSLDATVRCWDLRTDCVKSSLTFKGTKLNKFTSLGISPNGVLLGAGTELETVGKDNDAYVVFWDVRASQCVGAYSESHTDDVTQVKFHPIQEHLLASGSTDGLVCVYDLQESSEDDALFATFNTESSVHRIGWYKDTHVYVTTHIETVHGWETVNSDHLFTSKPVSDYHFKCYDMDYVADCVYDPIRDQVLCLAGKKESGCVSLLPVNKDGLTSAPVASISSVHSDSIRSCAVDWSNETLLTGGEDSQICLWDLKNYVTAVSPSVSSTLSSTLSSTSNAASESAQEAVEAMES